MKVSRKIVRWNIMKITTTNYNKVCVESFKDKGNAVDYLKRCKEKENCITIYKLEKNIIVEYQ